MNEEQRAEQAKDLLKHELFVEAFEVLNTELKNRWEHSSTNEVEARESVWLALQLLQRIRFHIESIVTTGKMKALHSKQSPFI